MFGRLSGPSRRKRRELELSIGAHAPGWSRWGPWLALLLLVPAAWLARPYLLPWLPGATASSAAGVPAVDVAALQSTLEATRQQLALEARGRQQDQAARESLAQELAALREENMHLKEDLASLRSLDSAAAPQGVQLSGFTMRAGAMPGEYRWHLLVAQDGRQSAPFTGRVHLRLEYAGTAPAGPDPAAESAQPLSFKYYQDVEGELRVPASRHPVKVWAEVWREGQRQPVASVSLPLS